MHAYVLYVDTNTACSASIALELIDLHRSALIYTDLH